ncbi:MAG: 50S ribosomal protein L32 [Candidatus Parcubacteria bacterium]|nr:50S ribosomal protein L32 [Candidatus Parcubacteria bacterium]
MGLPARHHSKSRRNKGRSHLALKAKKLSVCPKCAAANLSHKVCPNCGFYKNKEVVNVLKGLSKREKKVKEKEIKEGEKK